MTTDGTPPPRGLRLSWDEVPAIVRSAFEAWWGRRVVDVRSLELGFSPGVAARVRAGDGSSVFVKAVGPKPNPNAPAFHRKEAAIASRLPPNVPSPRLLWSYDGAETDVGESSGWVLLAFEELAGSSPSTTPWHPQTLDLVIDAVNDLASSLSPSPLPPGFVPPASEAFASFLRGWRAIEQDDALVARLDPWSRRHLDALADLEEGAADAAEGNALLHFDLRADNMVLDAGRVYFVDWPHGHVGAGWIDAAMLAPSVAMQGGPRPERLLERVQAYRRAPSEDVTAIVTAMAGYLTHGSLQPPPPGLPTVRAFQAAQGVETRRWLAERMGWDPP